MVINTSKSCMNANGLINNVPYYKELKLISKHLI